MIVVCGHSIKLKCNHVRSLDRAQIMVLVLTYVEKYLRRPFSYASQVIIKQIIKDHGQVMKDDFNLWNGKVNPKSDGTHVNMKHS